MPVSISSKINVGNCSFFATSDFIQSISLLNSPPLATFRNGSKRPLLLASNKNSMVSIPVSPNISWVCNSAINFALGIPTRPSNLFTLSANGLMAFFRLAEIVFAACSHCCNNSFTSFSFCFIASVMFSISFNFSSNSFLITKSSLVVVTLCFFCNL